MITPLNIHTELISVNNDGSRGNSIYDSIL